MENSHQHTICLCNVYTPTLPSLRHPSNFLYISCVELHLCFQGHWGDVVPKCILSLLSSTLPLQSKLPLKLPVPKPSPSDLVGVHPAPQEFKVFRIGRLAVGGTSHWKMGLIFFFKINSTLSVRKRSMSKKLGLWHVDPKIQPRTDTVCHRLLLILGSWVSVATFSLDPAGRRKEAYRLAWLNVLQ